MNYFMFLILFLSLQVFANPIKNIRSSELSVDGKERIVVSWEVKKEILCDVGYFRVSALDAQTGKVLRQFNFSDLRFLTFDKNKDFAARILVPDRSNKRYK